MTTAPLLLTLVLVAAPAPASAPAEVARGPAILDFHADWCGPCKQMRPRVDALIEGNYPVRSVDVDEHPELAERFKIEGVPTFVILGADGLEVARREGLVEARELADLYRKAVGVRTTGDDEAPTPVPPSSRPQVVQASNGGRLNPDPWATVVRIRVKDQGTMGFGSGTVIESTPEETIILTCAHIFGVKGPRPRPEQFHRRYPVMVELFDGKLGGPGGQTVRPLGAPMPGEVIDWDFDRDVALVRIRPGRIVPAARVVPAHWQPQAKMRMYTVGCSHGEDATAWNTVIYEPRTRYQVPGKQNYDAIECKESPKQGRSGGGLFTEDGYVAGVCNFAFDLSMRRGLYASPRSIYTILGRNNLAHLYEPVQGPQLFVADRAESPSERARSDSDDFVYRGQSPDGESVADSGARLLDVDPIVVPRPEFLGIRVPGSGGEVSPMLGRAEQPAAVPAAGRDHRPGRSGWMPVAPGGPSGDPAAARDDRSAHRPASVSGGSGGSSGATPPRREWAALGGDA